MRHPFTSYTLWLSTKPTDISQDSNNTANMSELFRDNETLEDLTAMRRRVLPHSVVNDNPHHIDHANNHNDIIAPNESLEPEEQPSEVEINPFLQKAKATDAKKQSPRWTHAEFLADAIRARQEDEENERVLTPDKTVLRTAKETHPPSNGVSSGHDSSDSKRRLEVAVFRWGKLKDTRLGDLMDGIPGKNDSNTKEIRNQLVAHEGRAQLQTLTYLKQSMQHLVEICPKFHDVSYPTQRKLLIDLFDRAKCAISRNLFAVESQAVDFANMFRGNEGERPMWQRLMRMRFLHLAMATYRHRILEDSKEENEKAIHIYQSHMLSRNLSNMVLDDTGDVPTLPRRSTAAPKKAKPRKKHRFEDMDSVDMDSLE